MGSHDPGKHQCETRRRLGKQGGAPVGNIFLALLLLSSVAGSSRRQSLPVPAETHGCSCTMDEGCVKSDLGCVAWTLRGYPEWNIMAGGLVLTPERTALISVLGAGKDIVMLSPSTPHAVLAAHRSRPSSLYVLHHRSSACRDAVETLKMAGDSSEPEPGKHPQPVIVHGLASSSSSSSSSSRGPYQGSTTLELEAPPATLADWYTMRRLNVGREEVEIVRAHNDAWRGGLASRLVVVHGGPLHHQAVLAAVDLCQARGRACSALMIQLDYDGEGAVFRGEALSVLGTLKAFEEASDGFRCYMHMSEWAGEGQTTAKAGVESGLEPFGSVLHPILDLVCLSRQVQTRPPEQVQIRWDADVNRQLAAMLRAFAPSYASKHTFATGVINPAACLSSPGLCRGPSNIRPFVATKVSRLGQAMPPNEKAKSLLASRIIQESQHAAGCERLLIFCYVNPGLAGHGAQAHEISQALSYAVASRRALVIDDSCAWDLHPTADGRNESTHRAGETQGSDGGRFWKTYMLPVSSCGLPEGQIRHRPPLAKDAGDGESDKGGGHEAPALLWDSTSAQSVKAVPPGAERWCSDASFSGKCLPVQFQEFGPAWWHAHLVAHAWRPSSYLEGLIEAGKNLLDLDHRFLLALHIRRGHKQIEIAPAQAEQVDVQLVTFLASALGIPVPAPPSSREELNQIKQSIARRVSGRAGPSEWAKVIVASEDKGAVSEIETIVRGLGVSSGIIDPLHPRPNLAVSIPMACRLGILDPSRENRVSLVSLFIMSRHADALIASFSSGYSRLIMELALVSRKYRMPHHSFDVPFNV